MKNKLPIRIPIALFAALFAVISLVSCVGVSSKAEMSDSDTSYTMNDVVSAQRYIANILSREEIDFKKLDIDKSGDITMLDAVMMQVSIAKSSRRSIDSYPDNAEVVYRTVTKTDTIAKWDISSKSDLSSIPLKADIGTGELRTNTTLSGYSSKSLKTTGWDNGNGSKYWEISFSTKGYSAVTLSADVRSSASGPRDFMVLYSTDGNMWEQISSYSVTEKLSPISFSSEKGYSNELVLPKDACDRENVSIRFLMSSDMRVKPSGNNTSVSASGAGNINNICVCGSYEETSYYGYDLTSDNRLSVLYLDVGQGDSTLIYLPNGEIMLIDCGKNAVADSLAEYLKSIGIESIDYLVGTHMDEDHIGGMDAVITALDIKNIYLPDVPEEITPTTKTYLDVLTAIDSKDYKINFVSGEKTLVDTGDFKAEFIAPVKGKYYTDINNYSIVTKLTYFERKFLFMGDASEASEKDILRAYSDLSADVLKCGHHGSSTSSSQEFLKAVNPTYAIISCGANNPYGHPHDVVISRLKDIGSVIYRTDLQKTIGLSCLPNGNITFTTELDSVSE